LNILRIHLPGGTDTNVVGTLMQFALYAAGVLGILILLAVGVCRIRQLYRTASKIVSGASAETIVNSRGWKAEADRLASAGEWRGACRGLYFFLLRHLDQKGNYPLSSPTTK